MNTVTFVGGPANTSKQELFLIGEIEGIKIGAETSDTGQHQQLLELATAYIAAAKALEPGFTASSFNASYARNNLSYLEREYDETGSLFRVFVPFSGDEDASEEVRASHTIAGMRGILEYEEDAELEAETVPEEVQSLFRFV